jgi:hypothetical protein
MHLALLGGGLHSIRDKPIAEQPKYCLGLQDSGRGLRDGRELRSAREFASFDSEMYTASPLFCAVDLYPKPGPGAAEPANRL